MDPQYPAGAIVWVKLEGGRWWPGEVASESDCSDVLENLRKPPLAVVKFFEEDCFHIVKSDQAIHPYDCAKKEEFLKRGKDFKMSGKDAFNLQSKFDSDVARAEAICRTTRKFIVSKNMRLPGSPRSANRSYIKAPSAERFDYNTVGEETRPFGLFWGRYEEPGTPRIRQQPATPKAKDSEYTCDTCGYKTARLENIVRHHKSHSDPYSFHPGKETEPMFVFEKAHPLKYRKKSHKDQSRHSTGSIHIHKSRSPQKKVDKGRIAFIPTPKKRKLPPDVSHSPKDSMSAKKKSKASQVVLSQVAMKKPFINPFEEEEETEAPAPQAPTTTEVPCETTPEVKETEEASLDLSTDISHEDLNDKDNVELEERKPVVSTVAWEEFIKDSPTKIHDAGVARNVMRHLSESDSENEPLPHEVGTGPTNGHVVADPLHASLNFVPLPAAEPVHVPVSHVSLPVSESLLVPVASVSLPTTEAAHIPVDRVSLPPAEAACVPVSRVSLPPAESVRVPVSRVSLPPAEATQVSVNQVSLPVGESVHVSVADVSLPHSDSASVSANTTTVTVAKSERVSTSKVSMLAVESEPVLATTASLPARKSRRASITKASLSATESEHMPTTKASLPVAESERVPASKAFLSDSESERMPASKAFLPAAESERVPASKAFLPATESERVPASKAFLPATESERVPASKAFLPAAESERVPAAESERVPASKAFLPAAESERVPASKAFLPAAESERVPASKAFLPAAKSEQVPASEASFPAAESERVPARKAFLPAAESERVPASKAFFPAAKSEQVPASEASFPAAESERVPARKAFLPAAEYERMPASNASFPAAGSERVPASKTSLPVSKSERVFARKVCLPAAQSEPVLVSQVSSLSAEAVRVPESRISLPARESPRGSSSHLSLPEAKSICVPVRQVSLPTAESARVSVSHVSLPAAESVHSPVIQTSVPAAAPAKVPVSRVSFSITDPRKAFKNRNTLLSREPVSVPVSHIPFIAPDPLQIPVSEIPLPPTEPLHVPVSEIPLPPSDPIHAPVSSIPLPEPNIVSAATSQECITTHRTSYSDSIDTSQNKKKNIDSRATHKDVQNLISVDSVKPLLPRPNEMTPDGCQKTCLLVESQPVEQMDCEEITELPVASAQIPSVSSFQVQQMRPFYDDVGSRQQLTPSVEEVHITQSDDAVEVVTLDDMTMHIDQETLRDVGHTHLHHLTVSDSHDEVVVENTDMVHGDIVVADGSLHAGDIMVGEEIEVQEIEIGEEVLQTEEIVLSDGVMHHVEIPLESDVHIGETSYIENNHGMSVDGRLNMNSGLVLQCVGTPYSSMDTTDRGCTGSQYALKERGSHYISSAKEAVNKAECGDTVSATEQLRLDECSIVNPAELSSSGSGLIAAGLQRKFDTVTTTTLDSRRVFGCRTNLRAFFHPQTVAWASYPSILEYTSIHRKTSGTSSIRGSLLHQ